MNDNERLNSGHCDLPNGSMLYWELNEVGGRRYMSDEIGGGIHVWDTCVVDNGTLLMAMAVERELEFIESRMKRDNENVRIS